eukprot:292023-Chlamydomonas_euryale.AAC.4
MRGMNTLPMHGRHAMLMHGSRTLHVPGRHATRMCGRHPTPMHGNCTSHVHGRHAMRMRGTPDFSPRRRAGCACMGVDVSGTRSACAPARDAVLGSHPCGRKADVRRKAPFHALLHACGRSAPPGLAAAPWGSCTCAGTSKGKVRGRLCPRVPALARGAGRGSGQAHAKQGCLVQASKHPPASCALPRASAGDQRFFGFSNSAYGGVAAGCLSCR